MALRIAVSVDIIISANIWALSRGLVLSKVKTSVGLFLPRYLKLSSLIFLSVTKQIVISPVFSRASCEKALRIAFFILVGQMGTFFWKFFMIIFTACFFRISYAAVIYAAQYPYKYR